MILHIQSSCGGEVPRASTTQHTCAERLTNVWEPNVLQIFARFLDHGPMFGIIIWQIFMKHWMLNVCEIFGKCLPNIFCNNIYQLFFTNFYLNTSHMLR